MEARSSKIEGQKRRITSKEYQRLLSKFEMEGFMAQKGLWNLVTGRALPEEGERSDVIGEYKAMREENFLSSWLREDGKDKDEIIMESREGDQRRDGQKEEESRVEKKRTKRRESKEDVSVPFLWRPLISSVKGEIWRVVVVFLGRTFLKEEPEDLSDCEPEARVNVSVVPDVTDVPVSPSSVVTEFCDVSSWCSDWEFVVNPSPFLSPKSEHIVVPVRKKG